MDQLNAQLYAQLYISIWWRAWSGWYEAAKILGVQFDEATFNEFLRWTRCVPIIYANKHFPVVVRWPVQVHWKDKVLHHETEPAVRFKSGWGLWMYEGVPLQQYHDETNGVQP